MLPHSAQRKDPSYRMAEGLVLKTDLTSHPPSQSATAEGYMTKSCFVNPFNEVDFQWKTNSKYLKWNMSTTNNWIILKF